MGINAVLESKIPIAERELQSIMGCLGPRMCTPGTSGPEANPRGAWAWPFEPEGCMVVGAEREGSVRPGDKSTA